MDDLIFRVAALEQIQKKHIRDIFKLKGNEQAHDFMDENTKRIKVLEKLASETDKVMLIRKETIKELEKKIQFQQFPFNQMKELEQKLVKQNDKWGYIILQLETKFDSSNERVERIEVVLKEFGAIDKVGDPIVGTPYSPPDIVLPKEKEPPVDFPVPEALNYTYADTLILMNGARNEEKQKLIEEICGKLQLLTLNPVEDDFGKEFIRQEDIINLIKELEGRLKK